MHFPLHFKFLIPHRINTEGVIERVKSLFEGHIDLILGFNQFLPPGYEIDIPESRPVLTGPISSTSGQLAPVSEQQSIATQAALVSTTSSAANAGQQMPAFSHLAPGPLAMTQQHPQYVTKTDSLSVPSPPKPTVEFNQAVSYVAKIKKRFEHAPEIYERFLRILHAYQEQRQDEESIEKVKSQITKLFKGHNDLLQEFSHFLPEGSMSAAEDVALADSSIPQLPPRQSLQSTIPAGRKSKSKTSSGKEQKKLTLAGKGRIQSKALPGGQFLSEESIEPVVGDSASKERYAPVLAPAAPNLVLTFPPNSKKELVILEGIKNSLPRNHFIQFLRCLTLYSKEIVSRSELLILIEDIFSGAPSSLNSKLGDLFIKFKDQILGIFF